MNPSLTTKIGVLLFSFAVIAFGGLEIYGVNSHANNTAWLPHEVFHAITGLFNLLTLCLFTLVLAWRFVKKERHRWAWWGLAIIGLSVFGGLVIGNPLSHGGLSGGGESLGNPELFSMLSYVSVVVWAVALALTWKHTDPATS